TYIPASATKVPTTAQRANPRIRLLRVPSLDVRTLQSVGCLTPSQRKWLIQTGGWAFGPDDYRDGNCDVIADVSTQTDPFRIALHGFPDPHRHSGSSKEDVTHLAGFLESVHRSADAHSVFRSAPSAVRVASLLFQSGLASLQRWRA